MSNKILTLLINLTEQLNFIDLEVDNPIKKCKNAIEVILISIANLKKIITKNNFKSDSEEIQFFKEIKKKI